MDGSLEVKGSEGPVVTRTSVARIRTPTCSAEDALDDVVAAHIIDALSATPPRPDVVVTVGDQRDLDLVVHRDRGDLRVAVSLTSDLY